MAAKAASDSTLIRGLIAGGACVGKTSLLQCLQNGSFQERYTPTIGVDFGTVTWNLAKLQIWDLAGQDRFQVMSLSYYRGGEFFLMCFDSHDEASFEKLKKIDVDIGAISAPNAVRIIVATKSDVPPTAASLKLIAEAKEYAEVHGGIPFYECSAKADGAAGTTRIADIFRDAAEMRLNTIAYPRPTDVNPKVKKQKQKRGFFGFAKTQS